MVDSSDSQRLDRTSIPVLCLDTCSILDIVRNPNNNNVRKNHHEASIDLLRLAENQQLDVCIADLVRAEYDKNIQSVRDDTLTILEKLKDSILKADDIISLYQPSIPHPQINVDHWLGHSDRCRQLADRWMSVGQSVPETELSDKRAGQRIKFGRAPSGKGDKGQQDCFIVECYLEYARKVRERGLQAPIVFVSSDHNDYYEADTSTLAEDLRADFSQFNMQFAPNMAAAKAYLGF